MAAGWHRPNSPAPPRQPDPVAVTYTEALSVLTFQAGYNTAVVLLGTGTPNADPDAHGPAVAVIVGDQAYLVDCGVGIVRRAAGGDLVAMDDPGTAPASQPTWSPDGSFVAWTEVDATGCPVGKYRVPYS